jgi:hypothetical protein
MAMVVKMLKVGKAMLKVEVVERTGNRMEGMKMTEEKKDQE